MLELGLVLLNGRGREDCLQDVGLAALSCSDSSCQTVPSQPAPAGGFVGFVGRRRMLYDKTLDDKKMVALWPCRATQTRMTDPEISGMNCGQANFSEHGTDNLSERDHL